MNTLQTVQSKNHPIEGIEAGGRYQNYMWFEQGAEASEVQFSLKCLNLPLGTRVGFFCSDPGPSPVIYLPPTAVIATPSFTIGIMTFVPANFTGYIYYYAEFSQQPPADASIQLQAAFPAGLKES
jgi:hypothetical protein